MCSNEWVNETSTKEAHVLSFVGGGGVGFSFFLFFFWGKGGICCFGIMYVPPLI
jgi:hypothetical protein